MSFYQTLAGRCEPSLLRLWVLLLLTIPALPVAAQDAAGGTATGPIEDASDVEERANTARALFAEGVEFVAASDWANAEARFREALSLRDAPAIRYNLASVLFEQGRYPEADALARSAAADSTASPDIQEHSNTLVSHIAEAAGYVTLEVIGGDDAVIVIDDWTVPDTSAEIPLSVGEHTLVGRAGPLEISREVVTVAQGEHRNVPIDATDPEAVGDDELEPSEPAAEPPLVENPWLWVGVGAGAVVLTAVIVGVAVATSGPEAPIAGNFMPGVITW